MLEMESPVAFLMEEIAFADKFGVTIAIALVIATMLS